MIIEDKKDLGLPIQYDDIPSRKDNNATKPAPITPAIDIGIIVERFGEIRDARMYYDLRNDLIEHLWQLKGETEY